MEVEYFTQKISTGQCNNEFHKYKYVGNVYGNSI